MLAYMLTKAGAKRQDTIPIASRYSCRQRGYLNRCEPLYGSGGEHLVKCQGAEPPQRYKKAGSTRLSTTRISKGVLYPDSGLASFTLEAHHDSYRVVSRVNLSLC